MDKKQFIWIMTDTTRFDMLGCYGNPDMKTPYLDEMANNGVRFERAYTAQPVCGPARSALFTGLYPHANSSWGNSMPLGADVLTLGQRLSKEGIKCGYIGKWHLDGGDYFGNGKCPEGWDEDYWYDMRCYIDELSDEDKVKSRRAVSCFEGDGIEQEFTFAYRCTQRALKFIEEHKDEDFFLVVSYDEPHDPHLCPPEFANMYNGYNFPLNPSHYDTLEDKPLLQQLWAKGKNLEDKSNLEVSYPLLLASNSYADYEIGRVLDAIKKFTPNSISLFTSDHGDAVQSHSLMAKGPSVYDEIARVPLIFQGKNVAANIVYPDVVSHIDLPATIMDYMAGEIPPCFSGKSLLTQLDGKNTPTNRDVFMEFNRYEVDHDGFGGFQPMRSIITNDYKLSINLLDIDELYATKNDPYDVNNLINSQEHSKNRNELHDRLLNWMNETRDPFRGYQWQCRPWRPELKPNWEVDGFTRQRKLEKYEDLQLDYATALPVAADALSRKKIKAN